MPARPRHDAAVSEVLATILLVGIAALLAATFWVWISGMGTNMPALHVAGFRVEAVDLPAQVQGAPAGDADDATDAVMVIYLSGSGELAGADLRLSIDGVLLDAQTSGAYGYVQGSKYCSSLPSGATSAASFGWDLGDAVYLWLADGNSCATRGPGTGLAGTHQLSLSLRGQVVLDVGLDVRDAL